MRAHKHVTQRACDVMSQSPLTSSVRCALRRRRSALCVSAGLLPGAGIAVGVEAAPAVFPAIIELSSLDGTNGFALNGVDSDDESGLSVSGAGELNGDGIDDIIIGGYRAAPNGLIYAGESYVVFGRTTGFPAADADAQDRRTSAEVFLERESLAIGADRS